MAEKQFVKPREYPEIAAITRFPKNPGSLREALREIPLQAYHGDPKGQVLTEETNYLPDFNAIALMTEIVDDAKTFAPLSVHEKFSLVISAYYAHHQGDETQNTFHVLDSTMTSVRQRLAIKEFEERAEFLFQLLPLATKMNTHDRHPLRNIETYFWLKTKLEDRENIDYFKEMAMDFPEVLFTDRELAERSKAKRQAMVAIRLRNTADTLVELQLLDPALANRLKYRDRVNARRLAANLEAARESGMHIEWEGNNGLLNGTTLNHANSARRFTNGLKQDEHELRRGMREETEELLRRVSIVLDRLTNGSCNPKVRATITYELLHEELLREDIDVAPNTLGHLFSKYPQKVNVAPRRSRNLTPEDVAELYRLIDEGLTNREIAERMGINSITTIVNHKKRRQTQEEE